jgi:ribonucleoside-diphosphate reductase alpha chain
MNVYSHDEALSLSKTFFEGDETPASITINKYLLRNKKDELVERSPQDMIDRVALEFHRIEKNHPNPLTYEAIHDSLDDFKVVPQGSPLAGIGNNMQVVSIGNCFVIGSPVDSWGGICRKDEELAQIMKRRGGCIEENNFVRIKYKGITRIKEVEIGDEILSYDIVAKKSEYKKVKDKYYTDVDKNNQICVKMSNGFEIQTSKTHPLLTIRNNEFSYIKAGELQKEDVCVIPEGNCFMDDLFNYDKSLDDIGWFIGAHTGDGSLGKIYKSRNKELPKGLRLRISGDNENVIKEFRKIGNGITESNSAYNLSTRKGYKSKVWEYTNNKNNLKELADEYFDGKVGRKSTDCKIFSFIKANKLFIPYLAGLIDTDGNVKKDGRIDIGICAKDIIEEMSAILSSCGIKIHISKRKPKKQHWHTIYRLVIVDIDFAKKISGLLRHEKKRETIEKICDKRSFSRKYYLTDDEIKDILGKYEVSRYKNTIGNIKIRNNKAAIICLLKKHNEIGLGGLKVFLDYNLINYDKYKEVSQRVKIIDVIDESILELKYIDIEVEGNNNYYAGSNGMINIHNCGLEISSLRPRLAPVDNAARSSDGIMCFMEKFSNTTKSVAMGGRRGALMISLDCRHPDLELFINAKKDKTKITGANLSVQWNDEFLNAVEKDEEYTLRFPVDSTIETAKYTKTVKARQVWNQFVEAAYASGEPGCLFWDTIIRDSLSDCYENFKTLSTNPCGELPLGEHSSCILMIVNLSKFVTDAFTAPVFDWNLFDRHVTIACRLIDDMIDLELEKMRHIIAKVKSDPEPDDIKSVELEMWKKIKTNHKQGRRVGLGVTGMGDMIAYMGLKYDSDEAIKFADEVFSAFHCTVMRNQAELAKERGPFPAWDWEKEKDCKYITMLPEEIRKAIQKHGRRNISVTTCSPTGTISMLTKTTSGIEPVFMRKYSRFIKITADDEKNGVKVDRVDSDGIRWRSVEVIHPGIKKWMDATGETNIEKSPYWKSEAGEISWKRRVEMQSVIQRNITHSISSTVNLPAKSTKEDVNSIYMAAWKGGCKGITVYVDGTRDGVLVSGKTEEQTEIKAASAPKRPKALECDIHYSNIGTSQWVLFVGKVNGIPYEIIGGKRNKIEIPQKYKSGWLVKNGKDDKGNRLYDLFLGESPDKHDMCIRDVVGEFNPDVGSYTRIVSVMLRHGIPIRFICDQLQKDSASNMFTFEKGIARVLSKYIKDGEVSGTTCETCKMGKIIYKDGCKMCSNCGMSYCS